jgi:hypothetical protein
MALKAVFGEEGAKKLAVSSTKGGTGMFVGRIECVLSMNIQCGPSMSPRSRPSRVTGINCVYINMCVHMCVYIHSPSLSFSLSLLLSLRTLTISLSLSLSLSLSGHTLGAAGGIEAVIACKVIYYLYYTHTQVYMYTYNVFSLYGRPWRQESSPLRSTSRQRIPTATSTTR